jgi:RNA polymerase sigma-70 factor, ECF subfamily
MDDAQLLAAVHRGDEGAFEAFVECYGRRLLAFGQRMCGHVEDGEDVFQDTLLVAFQSLADLRDPGALRSWLFRVAANACRMRRRKTGPHREVGLEEHFSAAGAAEGPPDAAAPRPDQEAARLQAQRAIAEALERLQPEQRMVVLLRDVEGLSTRETAIALSISEPAVKMRLLRARTSLRETLGEDFSLAE